MEKAKKRKSKYDEVFTLPENTTFETVIKRMVSPEVIAANMAKKKEKKTHAHRG